MMKPHFLSRRAALELAASLLLLFAHPLPGARAQPAPPQSPRAKQVEALVDRAVKLVDAKGKAAFDEFRRKGSEWYNGDTYIIIIDMKGDELFSAAFPQFEGKNAFELKDKNIEDLDRKMLDVLRKQDAGCVEYMWPKPGTTRPIRKWTYVKRVNVDSTPGGLGAGFYPD